MPKHATRTSFQKGKSGNPAGLKPGVRKTILELFGPLENLMMENVAEFLRHKDPNVRGDWTRYGLERLHGKVVERKEISGVDGGAIRIEDNTPDVRLLLIQAIPTKTIEGEKE